MIKVTLRSATPVIVITSALIVGSAFGLFGEACARNEQIKLFSSKLSLAISGLVNSVFLLLSCFHPDQFINLIARCVTTAFQKIHAEH